MLQFKLTATSKSLRVAVEAKASERAAISFTGNYMLKCSVSSNTLCEATLVRWRWWTRLLVTVALEVAMLQGYCVGGC